MTRTPRPSDVHRLPAAQDEPPATPPPQQRPRRAPLLAVGLAAAALLLMAVLADTGPGPQERIPVDVAGEDQAVAALGLFAAQDAASSAVGVQILGQPGPHELSTQARAHAEGVAAALRHARAQTGAPGPAAAYWTSPAHDSFVSGLHTLTLLADDIALLAAVHDTLYGGAGLVAPGQAEHALVNRFRAGPPAAAPLEAWSDALLAELDGHDAAALAAAARLGAEQHWADVAASLVPADTQLLREYLAALGPELVDTLRGHPVAGPALDRLEASAA